MSACAGTRTPGRAAGSGVKAGNRRGPAATGQILTGLGAGRFAQCVCLFGSLPVAARKVFQKINFAGETVKVTSGAAQTGAGRLHLSDSNAVET